MKRSSESCTQLLKPGSRLTRWTQKRSTIHFRHRKPLTSNTDTIYSVNLTKPLPPSPCHSSLIVGQIQNDRLFFWGGADAVITTGHAMVVTCQSQGYHGKKHILLIVHLSLDVTIMNKLSIVLYYRGFASSETINSLICPFLLLYPYRGRGGAGA